MSTITRPDDRDSFARWHDGFARIVALELAGKPVPEAYTERLAELDAECRRIEDERRATPPAQGALFDAPQRPFRV